MSKGGQGSEGMDSQIQTIVRALQPQEVVETPLSPEELAEAEKRAKEYSRLSMRRHREWQKDLSTKLQLKNDAIAALPPHLKEAAMIPDDALFPPNRQIWTETPPIFDEDEGASKKQKQQGKRKILGTKHR